MTGEENKNSQEHFWSGDFGDEYLGRNNHLGLIDNNFDLFQTIFEKMETLPATVLELGANIGLNVLPIKSLIEGVEITGVEINKLAYRELMRHCDAVLSAISDFNTAKRFDLTFTKTVLIHINPSELAQVYDLLYDLSKRYILVAEYYSPNPVEVLYRGHSEKLFKRDFAGEMLERFPGLKLIDYGFVYHRDPLPQDDLTWFLMEKRLLNNK